MSPHHGLENIFSPPTTLTGQTFHKHTLFSLRLEHCTFRLPSCTPSCSPVSPQNHLVSLLLGLPYCPALVTLSSFQCKCVPLARVSRFYSRASSYQTRGLLGALYWEELGSPVPRHQAGSWDRGVGPTPWARLSQAQTALRVCTRMRLAPGRNVPKAKHIVSVDVGAPVPPPRPQAFVQAPQAACWRCNLGVRAPPGSPHCVVSAIRLGSVFFKHQDVVHLQSFCISPRFGHRSWEARTPATWAGVD